MWHELDVEWRYRPDDPYAVRLDFGPATTGWLLSRETLAAGLRRPAGDGDVHVEPAEDGSVLVALIGRTGAALLAAPAAALERFLAETEGLVPQGREPSWIDWEEGVRVLLSA
ncbi:SsgA family sporulation/cell division regulator [Kitasatospora sp. NPDC002227]|uniref:SsgA family sporulation/cell division regulator n=1 Tax=Kitasatospora sp. NPDC002227 TaxID=3154773 RepID=UPI003327884F